MQCLYPKIRSCFQKLRKHQQSLVQTTVRCTPRHTLFSLVEHDLSEKSCCHAVAWPATLRLALAAPKTSGQGRTANPAPLDCQLFIQDKGKPWHEASLVVHPSIGEGQAPSTSTLSYVVRQGPSIPFQEPCNCPTCSRFKGCGLDASMMHCFRKLVLH